VETAVGRHYLPRQPRPLLQQIRNVPIKKRVQALPFLHAFCPAKTSHEGGGEHSADDVDKAIAVPTANRPSGLQNRETAARTGQFHSSLGHLARFRFDPVQRTRI